MVKRGLRLRSGDLLEVRFRCRNLTVMRVQHTIQKETSPEFDMVYGKLNYIGY